MKSLAAALTAGISRPLGIKASLQSWLGVPVDLQNHAFWGAFGAATSGSTFTRRRVTVDQALQLATVWACVRLIAETIASLPCFLYMTKPDGSRVLAKDHPLYSVLHSQPNATTTAVVFWECVVTSMLMWGNAYAEKLRNGNRVIGLVFLMPARVTATRVDGAIKFEYLDPATNRTRVIAPENVLHFPAFSLDGVFGVSPIRYGANVLSSAIETDRASAETFRDALRSPGLVKMDSVLNPQQREDIRKHVNQVSEEGGVMVLEKGAGFDKIGFDPVTAELLASRAFNVEELCRLFGVDPAMIGHGSKDSNWGTGLEQKMLWFIMFALRKWCVRIEQAISKSLLTPVERLTYFAEFALEGLLRGDSASRSAFYATMVQNGIFTRDFCRALENQPPMGGNAAVLTVQSNMLPIDKLGQQSEAVSVRDALAAWLGVISTGDKPQE